MSSPVFATIADTLTKSLHLKEAPVALSFTDSLPAGLATHTGRVPAGCRFWQEGALTAFATSAADHDLCSIGIYTHHLESTPARQSELMAALKVFGQLDYVRQEDIAMIPVLEKQHAYVIYSPLAQATTPPDVVLLFLNSNQSLVLSEAVQQVEHQLAPAMGRPACAVVPQVVNTGRAAMSLGCCGARAYLDLLDDGTALFALPGKTLEEYVKRIEALACANELLSQVHQLRRRDVDSGLSPTIEQSLAALQAG
ncbi:DUF169 domain-containing protein [Silvibacterium acidisoli]|uniref:DUF169 domain-containing protein n=1 Tax=Acidobacteriaceae bacterium ZG23-2 TaxID=2883246 RepID=UPI00406C5398